MTLWNACRTRVARVLGRCRRLLGETRADCLHVMLLGSDEIPATRPTDVRICDAGPGDVAHVESQFGAAEARAFERRLQGSRGWIAICGGEIAAWAFATTAPRERRSTGGFAYTVRPTAHDVFLHELFITEPYRHLRAAGRLVWTLLDHARQEGHRSVFLLRDEQSTSMARLCRHLGFHEWGRVRMARRLRRMTVDTTALDQWHVATRLAAPLPRETVIARR